MSSPLAALQAFNQWIVWKLEPVPDKPKLQKIPYNAKSGFKAASTNPADWCDYQTAANAVASGRYDGMGFVFTEKDPFFFADVDNALDPATGAWKATANAILSRFPGCAVETSQSGTGLHIFGMCNKAGWSFRTRPSIEIAEDVGLELYVKGRFVAISKLDKIGSADTWADEAVRAYAEEVFSYRPEELRRQGLEWSDGPCIGWRGPEDDDELLALMFKVDSRDPAVTMGQKPGNRHLFEGNQEVLGKKWPDPHQGRPFAPTEAEMALANTLAFWTGRDCVRTERLMRRSGLVRDKWDYHRTYLGETIMKACAWVSSVYAAPEAKPKKPEVPPPPPPKQEEVTNFGFDFRMDGGKNMLATDQMALFKGCHYLLDKHAVVIPGHKTPFDKARFDVLFAGFNFVTDILGKEETKSAFEAYTMSEIYVPSIVQGQCFRPYLESGALIQDGSRKLVNSYIPITTERCEGDPFKFLNLLERLLPIQSDREILIAYMASLVQNPGFKFQWWPVVQGVQGNGKTLIVSLLEHCVGSEYTHLVNVTKMAAGKSQFNGWIRQKLFLGFEEVYTAQRRAFLEEIKTLVTNRRLPVEGKGAEEVTDDNFANGVMMTNHLDGVPIGEDDRRYCVFYTAQQSVNDLKRDGMDGDYFPDLYDWFEGRNAYAGQPAGKAIMNTWLRNYQVPEELDPAKKCQRAPRTTSYVEAVSQSLGMAEQVIMEASGEGRFGFANGWISSVQLNALWEMKRINVPLNKRKDVMSRLGYQLHPSLPDGRATRKVLGDGVKSRLYLKSGHLALNITEPLGVVKAYEEAQEDARSAVDSQRKGA